MRNTFMRTQHMTKLALLPMLALLTACANGGVFGGTYKAPDVRRISETGEAQIVTEAKRFDTGIIKAFPDIAIPSTHRINLEESVIFTSPTQTVGKITLEGSGDGDSLYRFFEEQMTSNGWSLVNAFQSTTSSMYFAKPGKFAAVIIEAQTTGSKVYINVGPE